ncbi:MAG: DUF1080 domain-containing protein [Rubripirellula sp.]|nr:DUF1080 domain-containing protein [Rubripirellula sp.]
MMQRLAFTMFTTLVISLSAVHATAADQWVALFDGKTLEGWQKADLGKAEYKVVDGTIYGKTVEGSPNTFLASQKQYADFELEFEVKVHDKLNSGCQIRSRGKTQADVDAEAKRTGKKNRNNQLGRFHGPQVEIESSPGQAGYVYGEATGRGWLSPEPQDKKHSHDHMQNGEWNQYRIVAKGPRIQTWINGEMVADLTDEDIYKSHPKGHIGLQVHGIKAGTGPYDVAWRNIRIREH